MARQLEEMGEIRRGQEEELRRQVSAIRSSTNKIMENRRGYGDEEGREEQE